MNFMKAIVAAGLVAASTSAFASDISGAGATFPYPIYAKWADAYKKETGNGMNYQSIGSGGGIKQIQSKTVTFGATDMPLKPEDLTKYGLVQCPTVVGGDVPVVNLEGVKSGDLKLDGDDPGQDLSSARSSHGTIPRSPSSIPRPSCPSTPSSSSIVPTVRARRSSGPTIFRRSAPTGNRRSAPTPRLSGRPASAPRAMKASPITSPTPRAPSAMSNMPTPSRTR